MGVRSFLFNCYYTRHPIWRLLLMYFFIVCAGEQFRFLIPIMSWPVKFLSVGFIVATAFFFLATILTSNESTKEEIKYWKKQKHDIENDFENMTLKEIEVKMKEIYGSEFENEMHEQNEKNELNKINDMNEKSDKEEDEKIKSHENELVDEEKYEKYRKDYIKYKLINEEYYIKYCYFCKNQMTRWDHHCPFVSCCIGIRNHFYFTAMVLCFLMMLAIHQYYNFLVWYGVVTFSLGRGGSLHETAVLCITIMKDWHVKQLIFSIIILIIHLILSSFFIFHLTIIGKRSTTYSESKVTSTRNFSLENLTLCIKQSGSINFKKIKRFSIELFILASIIGAIVYKNQNATTEIN